MNLFVSNWSSHRTVGAHGAGHKWSIMARPRRWEHGDGSVPVFVPDGVPLAEDSARGLLASP